jgi:hypothetical protein
MTHILIHVNPTHPSNIPHTLEQLNPIPTCSHESPPALAFSAASRYSARTFNVPQKPWGMCISIAIYDDGEEVGEAVEISITWFEAERDGRCEGHIREEEGGRI